MLYAWWPGNCELTDIVPRTLAIRCNMHHDKVWRDSAWLFPPSTFERAARRRAASNTVTTLRRVTMETNSKYMNDSTSRRSVAVPGSRLGDS